MRILEGGCLCGSVRYRIVGDMSPEGAGYCHCRMCQRASGAPVVAWATFPAAAVTFSGEFRDYRSSAIARRLFCPACGTQIAWTPTDGRPVIDITLASLDDPDAITPAYHIWTDSQRPWLHLADGLPRYPDGRHD